MINSEKIEFENAENLLTLYLSGKIDEVSYIDPDVVCSAGEAIKNFYALYDKMHGTDHLNYMNKIFATLELTHRNSEEYGFSVKTYYRYRKNYINAFKYYLQVEIDKAAS